MVEKQMDYSIGCHCSRQIKTGHTTGVQTAQHKLYPQCMETIAGNIQCMDTGFWNKQIQIQVT